MHLLIELIAAFVVMLAALALSQFGVDLNANTPDREVRRISECSSGSSVEPLNNARDC